MMQWTVGAEWQGKRLDRFLFAHCPQYPGSMLHKAFRKRDVRVNNKRSSGETVIACGDTVTAYLPDMEQRVSSPAAPAREFIPLILHEDAALLVVNKPQGVVVQPPHRDSMPASRENFPDVHKTGVLPDAVQTGEKSFDRQLQQWWAANRTPLAPGFPALCHRLDRNTGGLLMLAKTEEALQAVANALRTHQIRKKYRCMVAGVPTPPSAIVDAWLEKDATAGRVYIHEEPRAGAVPIRTTYRVLAQRQDISLLDVEIITGRTHQIRAQLARLGHPILGDSRYGSNAVNRRYGVTKQLLWAYELVFSDSLARKLPGVAGKTITCGIPMETLPPQLHALISDHPERHTSPQA